jgi:type II secretory pathway component PulK
MDMRRIPGYRPVGERGFVLVIVLWILAILTVISVGFGRRAVLDRRAAAYTLDKTQATFLARGAAERGIIELRNKATIDAYLEQGGHTGFEQQWNKAVNLFEEEGYYEQENAEAFADDICRYVIVDESAKININSAPIEVLEEIEALRRPQLRRISQRRGLGEPGEDPPQRFLAIEEIRYIEGIDDEAWYGSSRSPGLKDLLTCYSDGRINVNTAPRAVLECIPDLSESVIDAIITYRQGPDGELGTSDDRSFTTLEEVMHKAELGSDVLPILSKYCSVDSRFFTVKGYATRRQGKVQGLCEAVVEIMGDTAMVIQWRESAYGL